MTTAAAGLALALALLAWPMESRAALRMEQLTRSGRLREAPVPTAGARWAWRAGPRPPWSVRRSARESSSDGDVIRAIRLLAQELAGGSDPARAWAGAAAVGGPAGPWLAGIARRAEEGGDVGAALARAARSLEALRPELGASVRRLGAAWSCGAGSGASAADVALHWVQDAEYRMRAQAALTSQLAGPRACAAMLALLPVLGLAMGAGMGADPVRVLTQTPAGLVLLVAGGILEVLGLLWVRRIVRTAQRA